MTIVLRFKDCWKVEIFLDERVISKSRYEGNSLDDKVIVPVHSSKCLLENVEKLLAEHTSLRHLVKFLLGFELFGFLSFPKGTQDKHESFFEREQISIF